MKYSVCNPSQVEEINQLFIKTFSDTEGESEGLVIGELTNNFMTNTNTKDFYCFVATDLDKIIGGVFFSKFTLENNTKAFILSPMATLTAYQGKGIGQHLINFSHNILKEIGVELLLTYGDINFYSKVGYQQIKEEIIPAPHKLSYPEGWLGQSLISNNIEPITGKSFCVKALCKAELW
ncbi:MAG: GNAT family N-acetyltransferase [Bacteroidetes bacterium 4572_77]|nr:MAG: GNAT family N-acetyltransferase [Bacteroidetes bacterium 4572_77]